MIEILGSLFNPPIIQSAKLVAFDSTDLPEPGLAKYKSIQVVCIGEPGWYGHNFPSGDLNTNAPELQGEQGLNSGNMQSASSKEAAVLVATLLVEIAGTVDT